MEYQKITNLLDYTQNQPSKFKTKNLVEITVTHVERTALVVKLNLTFQCQSQVYGITVMHIYLLKVHS